LLLEVVFLLQNSKVLLWVIRRIKTSCRASEAQGLTANANRFPTAVFCATYCGLILTRTSPAGVKTTEVFHSRSVPTSSPVSSRSMIWT
jgi:hypothetical protein